MNRQKSTFRISFYVRRTRPNKHGEVPVCVRITVNGQRADTTSARVSSPINGTPSAARPRPAPRSARPSTSTSTPCGPASSASTATWRWTSSPSQPSRCWTSTSAARPRTATRSSSSSASTTTNATSWWASIWPLPPPSATRPA